jgi:hypothetical protein
MSTILEDNNVREKRWHICPKRGLWTILSVKKWTYFLGSINTSPVKTIFGSFQNQKSGFFLNSDHKMFKGKNVQEPALRERPIFR